MRATSVHRRRLAAPVDDVGALIDTLSSADDRLWPHQNWPAMRFDGPLAVGAAGGHAFIRYRVEAYRPGSSVTFRITGPRGFAGIHRFDTQGDGDAAIITHSIDATVTLRFAPKWFGVVRPLHDALMEDALDNAERETTGTVADPARWSWWVRLLRRLLRPKR